MRRVLTVCVSSLLLCGCINPHFTLPGGVDNHYGKPEGKLPPLPEGSPRARATFPSLRSSFAEPAADEVYDYTNGFPVIPSVTRVWLESDPSYPLPVNLYSTRSPLQPMTFNSVLTNSPRELEATNAAMFFRAFKGANQVPLRIYKTALATVVLAWDANTETNLAGYNVYYGTASRSYEAFKPVGNTTTSTSITNLQSGTTYYFAVTAKNTAGMESAYSSEVGLNVQ
jgi:hypothetical protein